MTGKEKRLLAGAILAVILVPTAVWGIRVATSDDAPEPVTVGPEKWDEMVAALTAAEDRAATAEAAIERVRKLFGLPNTTCFPDSEAVCLRCQVWAALDGEEAGA